MTYAKSQMRYVCLVRVCIVWMMAVVLGWATFQAHAQSGQATLNGQVVDTQNAAISAASVTIISTTTAVQRQTTTNKDGSFTFEALQPGSYSLHVEHPGFAATDATDLTLHTADSLAVVVKLKVGSVNQAVTVSAVSLTNDNPAVSMTVDREFVENMPLNGRSFQDLIQLAPGAVSSEGYYSINGQRMDSNNYTVDGVSANLGGVENSESEVEISAGAYMAGAVPAQTVLGTTQSLAALDSLQEFTIQTSGYTAEYGRSPGGQVQFTTRSGTNTIHGSAFEYLRNTIFDANSYNNDYDHIAKTAEHQNDFGGTVGGPVIIPKLYNGRDKSFYFLSYEGLRLLLPEHETEYVPTQGFRNAASPYIQPFLNADPLPNGADNSDGCTVNGEKGGPACDALFNYAYSYPSNIDNYSARIDQSFGGRFHAFVRYADTPSYVQTGAEQITTNRANVHSWTAGLTTVISSRLLDDLRFNYSRDGEQGNSGLKSVGGSIPYPKSMLIPSAYDGPYADVGTEISLAGTSLSAEHGYSGTASAQHQHQLIDNLSWTRGRHSVKFGVDWRHLTPEYTDNPYQLVASVTSLADIQNGYATSLVIEANAPGLPIFDNLSLYAQDHWKINPKLTVDYGLRWDFNPPPGPSNGHYPVTLTSNNLATATLTNDGTQPYKTNYHSFGPRFGFAWNALPSQSHSVTVRGGVGIFFDTAQQVIGAAYTNVYPFGATRPTQSQVLFPLSDAALAPPSLNIPVVPPYPSIEALSSPDLTAPYTEQWNLSVDYALNPKNTLTASYVGNNGRKLLFTGYYGEVPGNQNFTSIRLTSNAAQSSYNALQIQDVGRLTNGLSLVGSFTWAHALDNASSDFSSYSPIYGNSNYDLRRVLNLALNYQTPTVSWSHWMESVTHGWMLANRFAAQSGDPLSITQATVVLPDGTEVQYTPDLVPGVPMYLHGRTADVSGAPVPGGWRLNRAAFACTTNGATSGACPGTPTRQGTLGRNYVREPAFWAWNTALQRSFPIYEHLHADFRVDAFNILNHPNLIEIQTSLSASTFGLNQGNVGTIGAGGTASSPYAMGAARSLQFSLHLQF